MVAWKIIPCALLLTSTIAYSIIEGGTQTLSPTLLLLAEVQRQRLGRANIAEDLGNPGGVSSEISKSKILSSAARKYEQYILNNMKHNFVGKTIVLSTLPAIAFQGRGFRERPKNLKTYVSLPLQSFF